MASVGALRCLSEYIRLGSSPGFSATHIGRRVLVALSLYHSLFGNHINFIFRSWVPWAVLSAVLIERHITDVAITWAGHSRITNVEGKSNNDNHNHNHNICRLDIGKIRRRTYDVRSLNARYLVESRLRISGSITVLFTVTAATLFLVRGVLNVLNPIFLYLTPPSIHIRYSVRVIVITIVSCQTHDNSHSYFVPYRTLQPNSSWKRLGHDHHPLHHATRPSQRSMTDFMA